MQKGLPLAKPLMRHEFQSQRALIHFPGSRQNSASILALLRWQICLLLLVETKAMRRAVL
jgi:hypothetical protein